MSKAPIEMRHESMRIAGRKVDTVERVEVRYPYTDEAPPNTPAKRLKLPRTTNQH